MERITYSDLTCKHCGTTFVGGRSDQFCCSGCEFVFNLIQAQGLGDFYRQKNSNPPECAIPVKASQFNYDYFDDLEFITKYSLDGIRIKFYLENVNCTACLWLLEKLPSFCADADFARLNISTSTIEVSRKPQGSFAKIAQTLDRFGYRPHVLHENENSNTLQLKESRRELIRLGVAGALTGNIMIFAVSLYAGATGELATQFQWLSGILALPVITYCACPFYRNTWASIRTMKLNLDVPIVVAILAGILNSIWALATKSGLVYFDSLSMLTFLLLSSRYILKSIQARQLGSASFADEVLLGSVLLIDENGNEERVSSHSVLAGECIKIEDGRFIPVDGIVESGSGSINVAMMTGESQPLLISSGVKVEAGSQKLEGDWVLRVTHSLRETRLAKILSDTDRAAKNKPEIIRFSEAVSQWFIAIVFAIALGLLLFFASGNFQDGVTRALALVIVTCPCVFGIAIPMSMSLATRISARKGIIIKDTDAIEKLWKIKALYFDKTGTLTSGHMNVLEVSGGTPEELAIALELEKDQTHPVAQAITEKLRRWDLPIREVGNLVTIKEGGVAGTVNGQFFSLRPITYNLQSFDGELIRSAYGLFNEDKLVVTFYLGDRPRKESVSVLSWARKNNFITRIISGDKKSVVDDCAKKLGFSAGDVYSEMSPESKAKKLSQSLIPTAMIGDGANDAAALAEANVGIAICGSLDVSLRAADVYLAKPNLMLVPELFRISELTKSAIQRNLLFSAAFNIVSGVLAISGYMTPLWAAVLMPVSSLTVLMSSLWTGRELSRNKVGQ